MKEWGRSRRRGKESDSRVVGRGKDGWGLRASPCVSRVTKDRVVVDDSDSRRVEGYASPLLTPVVSGYLGFPV